MAKDPTFPFYVRDWLTDTRMLSAAARGAYIDLLANQWLIGRLPVDQLHKLCGMDKSEWAEVRDELAPFFKTNGLFWVNNRLNLVREERETFLRKQRANGSLGGRPAKPKQGKRNPKKGNPVVNSGLTQTKPKNNLASASALASAQADSGIVPASLNGEGKGNLRTYAPSPNEIALAGEK